MIETDSTLAVSSSTIGIGIYNGRASLDRNKLVVKEILDKASGNIGFVSSSFKTIALGGTLEFSLGKSHEQSCGMFKAVKTCFVACLKNNFKSEVGKELSSSHGRMRILVAGGLEQDANPMLVRASRGR